MLVELLPLPGIALSFYSAAPRSPVVVLFSPLVQPIWLPSICLILARLISRPFLPRSLMSPWSSSFQPSIISPSSVPAISHSLRHLADMIRGKVVSQQDLGVKDLVICKSIKGDCTF